MLCTAFDWTLHTHHEISCPPILYVEEISFKFKKTAYMVSSVILYLCPIPLCVCECSSTHMLQVLFLFFSGHVGEGGKNHRFRSNYSWNCDTLQASKRWKEWRGVTEPGEREIDREMGCWKSLKNKISKHHTHLVSSRWLKAERGESNLYRAGYGLDLKQHRNAAKYGRSQSSHWQDSEKKKSQHFWCQGPQAKTPEAS